MTGLMLQGVLIVEDFPSDTPKFFDSLFRRAGLSRDSFGFTNCQEDVEGIIRARKPKAILALGNGPLGRLCGVSGITRYRGYPLTTTAHTWVVPTHHPTYLLPRKKQKSTSHLTPAVIFDFKKAISIAKDGFARPVTNYLEDPSPIGFEHFVLDYESECESGRLTYLSWDIETPYKLKNKDEENFAEIDGNILRISFCFRPGYAASVPWTGEYLPLIARLLSSPGAKVVWNGWHFDEPLVRQAGLELGGQSLDGMWAFHYFHPDLPRGLESAGSFFFNGEPWKHLAGDRPALYSCIDADVALQNFLGTKAALLANGQWQGFMDFVVELEPFLQEAGHNGILIDPKQRRATYKKLRQDEKPLIAAIQPLVPEAIKPLKHYKRFPAIWEGKRAINTVSVQGVAKVCTHCGLEGVTKAKHTARKGGKGEISLNLCYKAEIVERPALVSEWDVVMDFNPNSTAQIASYMQFVGHPTGKSDSGAPSVDDLHLQKTIAKFGDQFPIYGFIRKLKVINKTKSFVVKTFKPNSRGVVETVYTNAPASGRLSSKGIKKDDEKGTNLQNIVKKDGHPYSDDVRRMVIPPPGYVFVEADSSAIEAVITGKLMGDDDFINIARKSVYAYVACKELGLDFTDENVRLVKDEHKGLYKRKKQTILGLLYGEGAWLLWFQYPHIYASEKAAQREIDSIYRMLPKLKDFHHHVRMMAHQQHYLQNAWGYRRYFYNVFKPAKDRYGNPILKPDGTPKVGLGEDGKSAISQQPQSCAAFFNRENARNIGREIKERKLDFILPGNWLIHDSYLLVVPNNPTAIETAKELLKRHLVRPIPQLDGLVVGCEVSVGHNWTEMKVVETVQVE